MRSGRGAGVLADGVEGGRRMSATHPVRDDIRMRVIKCLQALELYSWALHARLDDSDASELEAFSAPTNEAAHLLHLFLDRFLGGPTEEIEAIAGGKARLRADGIEREAAE